MMLDETTPRKTQNVGICEFTSKVGEPVPYFQHEHAIDYIGYLGFAEQLAYAMSKTNNMTFNWINPEHIDDAAHYMKSSVLFIDSDIDFDYVIANLPSDKKAVLLQNKDISTEKEAVKQIKY